MGRFDYDVVIIGSGFGGSVAALRATEKGYRVGVLEAGRRFGPGDFATSTWHIRRYLWLPRHPAAEAAAARDRALGRRSRRRLARVRERALRATVARSRAGALLRAR